MAGDLREIHKRARLTRPGLHAQRYEQRRGFLPSIDTTWRGRWAATKPARRSAALTAADGHSSRHRPCGASPRPQSSKQDFQHGEAGRATEDHGEGQFGASRGARCNTARSATLGFSVVLSGSPWFSVLKACLLWDRHPRPVVDGSRLADARTCASCNRPALRAVLSEAPTNQCVIDIAAEIRRRPR